MMPTNPIGPKQKHAAL